MKNYNDGTAKPIIPLMYEPLKRVFEDTMTREGKEVRTFTSNVPFRAFFRKNNDNNNITDRVTIYYQLDAPVRQGILLKYMDKIYLVLNKETEENDCYYKSSCIACNGTLATNDGRVGNIPVYANDMRGSIVGDNYTLNVVDGKMELLTEDNEKSHQLKINDRFNEFGRTFKLENIYHKDGITHLRCDVIMDEKPIENLRIAISGLDALAYKVGDSVMLNATLYKNNNVEPGTIEWESTDPQIATIEKTTGKGIFLKEGLVAFRCRWVEKNYIHTTDNVTVSPIPTETYTAKLTGRTDLYIGRYRNFTAALLNSQGVEVSSDAWTFAHDFVPSGDVTITNLAPNKVKVEIADVYEHVGKKFNLTATETTHNVSASIEIMVAEPF